MCCFVRAVIICWLASAKQLTKPVKKTDFDHKNKRHKTEKEMPQNRRNVSTLFICKYLRLSRIVTLGDADKRVQVNIETLPFHSILHLHNTCIERKMQVQLRIYFMSEHLYFVWSNKHDNYSSTKMIFKVNYLHCIKYIYIYIFFCLVHRIDIDKMN